jgi:CRISPR-associated protein Csx17
VDLDRTLRLAQALMALDWRRVTPGRRITGPRGPMPDPAWLALRCCCLAGCLPDGRCIPCDPALLRRLRADDAGGALAIALRRLRSSGIRPPLQAGGTDPATARRWAAALIFPITPAMAAQAVAHLAPALEGAYRG